MRVNKIVLAAVAALATLTACSSQVSLASNASPASATTTASSTAPTTTTTTVAPTTTTTTTKVTTTTPPPPPPTTTTTKPRPVGNAPGTPCKATVAACVSKSQGKAWLIYNGQVLYGPVPMMPGKASAPTPVGMFQVLWKVQHDKSKEFNNAPMENSVYFTSGGVAFHEGSLSVPSAGCVHLTMAASAKFFANLDQGDPVQVVA
ncbi:hypothetical protein BC739_007163 [Kutzneria viridogrisea]|uniref:L,D-TPase catalytic domain-containing protein n=2 Tax=Kutzneria TaxID=43356 RepID=W5VZB9_9PSEU|nr:L,D-transpeptidase [Kutzneria albida]AHH94263.1 hypothetical protein KALB_889 [Kutzneria albida DSM 43870]MBA8929930.1 hypothetical protein [Kutzneria viridogrisea]